MSNLFLLNSTIDLENFINFKVGMFNLLGIEKEKEHVFRKHASIYYLPIYEVLCSNYGQEEQVIITFIEQLSPCENYIDDEDIKAVVEGIYYNMAPAELMRKFA